MRILHAPDDTAGQASFLAKQQRLLGYDSTSLRYIDYPTDKSLHLDLRKSNDFVKSARILSAFFNNLNYDVYHLHSNTLIPIVNADIPILKVLNKKVLINLHGTEARLKYMAVRNNPYIKDIMEDIDCKVNRYLWWCSRFFDTACVGDYELYEYAKKYFPKVEIIPRLVDYNNIQPNYPISKSSKLNIVHAPTNRKIKGTGYILKAMENLGSKANLTLIENLNNRDALKEIEQADIYIDQLILGTFGVSSLEAMAFGKPVIAYIREDLVSKYPDLPIINANPDNLEKVLKNILSERDNLAEIGRMGREYVMRYHNIESIVQKYFQVYERL
ncbi:MAG: glycosyltransferase [Patescibacteria group bacterium]